MALEVNGCHSIDMSRSRKENGRRMEGIKDFMVLH